MSGKDLVALDEQSVINDEIDMVLLGDELAVMALACAGAAYQCVDFDSV